MDRSLPAEHGRFFRPRPQKLISELRGLGGVSFIDLQTFYSATGADQSGSHKLAGGKDVDALAAELARQVERVWKEKGMPATTSEALLKAYAARLGSAVDAAFDGKIAGPDYDTPDLAMYRRLQTDVFQFSAAKNYTQLRQLSQALLDEDGKLRTYSQFKAAALEMNDAHVGPWLKAEYELAVSGSQMASKWADIKANGATILEFDAVNDGRTSQGCRLLNGVRKAVDDPFWDRYYPPNHYHCRSTVRQHYDGTVTPDDKIEHPDAKHVPPMFRVNLGKRGLAFPPDHPYWKDTPPAVLNEALRTLGDDAWLPVEDGRVRIHSRVDTKASDFRDVMEVATDVAVRGHRVDVMPRLDSPDDPLNGVLFKGAKPGKYPDLRVDETVFLEVKSASTSKKSTVKGLVKLGSSQADWVIVRVPGELSQADMQWIVDNKFNDHPGLQKIEFRIDGVYHTYDRPKK